MPGFEPPIFPLFGDMCNCHLLCFRRPKCKCCSFLRPRKPKSYALHHTSQDLMIPTSCLLPYFVSRHPQKRLHGQSVHQWPTTSEILPTCARRKVLTHFIFLVRTRKCRINAKWNALAPLYPLLCCHVFGILVC